MSQNKPVPVVMLDPILHDASNGYTCADPTCPCALEQPEGYRCCFCGSHYSLADYVAALSQPYPKCSHYWSDYEPVWRW